MTNSVLTLNRREIIANAAKLGIAVAVLPSMGSRLSAEGKLSYYTWAGYEAADLHKGYTAKFGAEPSFSFFGDEDEALAKIRAGFSPSIAHPCTASVVRWRDAGVIKPFDVSRLKSWPDLAPQLTNIGGMNSKAVYWIPFDWGSNSVVFRTDKVDPAYVKENSWKILWDERYAGKIGMWTSVDGAVAMASAVLGIKDTTNVSDAQFNDIKKLLADQKKLVRFYWDSETVAEEGLSSGELVASYLWGASFRRLKQNGVPVDYMPKPKEGIVSFACGFVLLANGEGDDQQKYDFIESMLDPQSGKFLIETYGYGHSNMKSYQLVPEETIKAQGLTRDISGYLSTTSFFQAWPNELRQRYIAMFNDIKSRS